MQSQDSPEDSFGYLKVGIETSMSFSIVLHNEASLSVKHSSSSGCICIVSEPSGLRTKGQGCLKRSSCHYTMVFSQDIYISMNAHTSIVCHYAYDTSATTSMIDTESICSICTLMIPAHWAVCTCLHIYIRIPE